MRTLLALALALIATPALAGDLPWTYHSGGSQYQGARIVGGRSVSPKRYRRSYDRPRYRDYGRRGGDTIIIIEQPRYRGRWR